MVEPFLALGRAGSGGYMLMPLALLQKNNNKKNPKGPYREQTHFTEEESEEESDAIIAQGTIADREPSWVQTHTSWLRAPQVTVEGTSCHILACPCDLLSKVNMSSRDTNRASLAGEGGQTS